MTEPSGFRSYWNDSVYELGPKYDDVHWTSNEYGSCHAYVILEDGNAEIVDMTYFGYWIPESVDGIPVTAIGELGISDRLDYPSGLEIPAWITGISENVFRWAHKDLFSTVDAENPNFIIENEMLFDLRNHTLLVCMGNDPCDLPEDVEHIACRAMSGFSFVTLVLPDHLKSIGDAAFADCPNLSSVTIPDSVYDIGANPFINCPSLREIIISPDHPVFGFRDGILYRKADMQAISILPSGIRDVYTLPGWIKSLGPYLFCGNSGLKEAYIPCGITEIPCGTFSGCINLTDVVLPEAVESIGPCAFADCQIRQIVLPAGLKELGVLAFVNCRKLNEIRFPEEMTAIREAAFAWCDGLVSVVLPQNLTILENEVFAFCRNLRFVVIPDSVTSIGSDIFYEAHDVTVKTPPDSRAYDYCSENKISCICQK